MKEEAKQNKRLGIRMKLFLNLCGDKNNVLKYGGTSE